ncbi:hypothetical protein RBG61_04450 [Paludicola sp. MB14-C6]|uniref:hypothetical protein n=1 Tax=Paludihabitans sp. MB14-C6 TaxID=3070656 RepID=UPI0027DD8086|nr:hypothetical protein [Paludicola sp. MB14-C6]WMJ23925.1 hypothetical protein RBG61_04450 [Paludicola sp. MB14-C6]
MKLHQIVKQSAQRLKCNIGKAIGLLFLLSFAYFTVLLVEQVISMVLKPTLINPDMTMNFSGNTLLITLIPLSLYFILVKPFLLNVKGWNYKLVTEDVPLQEAVNYFGTWKSYWRAVWYSLIKSIIITLIYVGLLVPVMALLVALRVQIEVQGEVLGLLFAILFLLTGVFFLLAVVYATYITIGFFFADYIYVSEISTKPFTAFRISFQIAKNKKGSILVLWLAMLPLFLFSCFVLPAIICIPLINLIFAFYAKDRIANYFTAKNELDSSIEIERVG